MSLFEWDAFVSHASEDKLTFVVPLVDELRKYGLRIWFDAFSLTVGDSLRESIDHGLAESEYGIVVLSHSFFAKNWPPKELNALFGRHLAGKKVILPVWHDILHDELLRYSPLLADVVACKSSDGIQTVAKTLAGVIRPEAFELQTSISDTQRTAERVRENLRTNNPSLDCRVTFGPKLSLDANGADEPGLIGSVAADGFRLDLFAQDPATYNRNPISYNVQLTQEAWSKIQEGLRSGETINLSEEHLCEVSPEFYTSLGFDAAMFTRPKSLVLTPKSQLLNRIFRFRLRFANGNEAEEFAYVEFRIVRAGTGEFTFASAGSQLPFELTLTVYTDRRPPVLGWTISYTGQAIRKVYRAQKALQYLRQGGSLEFFDLEQDTVFARFQQPKPTLGSEEEFWAQLDRFVTDLHTVAEATKSEITWGDVISDVDCIHTGMLIEAISTGRVTMAEGTIDIVQDASEFEKIRTGLERWVRGLVLRFSGSPAFGIIFGQAIDLGNYRAFVRPTGIEPVSQDKLVHTKIKGEITLVFDEFERS